MLSGIFTKLKPFLKLCLALGIVAGLVGSIYLAKQSAEDQMKDFEKNKEQDGAMGSEITVKNYNLREVDGNNKLRWELNAASGVRNGKTADVDLTGIEVKYYNEGQVSFNLSAPVGKASELTHVIVLSSKDGKKVLGLGTEKQTRLETSEMELNKKNQFKATGGVNIEWPGVAKVTGDSADGVISQVRLIEHIIIKGNTRATIQM